MQEKEDLLGQPRAKEVDKVPTYLLGFPGDLTQLCAPAVVCLKDPSVTLHLSLRATWSCFTVQSKCSWVSSSVLL